MADTTQTGAGTETQTTAPTDPEVKGNTPLTAPTDETVETKSGEEKPGETKPGEKAEDKKPDATGLDLKSLKLPEGVTLDEKVGGEFVTILTDDKLAPQERMQKLVDLHTAELQKIAGQPLDTWNKTVEQWTKEIAADKEIGTGINEPLKAIKPAAMAKLGKVMDMLGGQPLRAALELTGAGNNPAVIKAFMKIADKYSEGNFVTGSPTASGKPTGPSPAALYPDNPTG